MPGPRWTSAWNSTELAVPGVQVWTVSAPEAGQKLLQFLQRRLAGAVPASALQRWIRTGQVRVNGSRAKPGTRLEANHRVRIPPHDLPEPGPPAAPALDSPEDRLLHVVHEDYDLLVLAKPKGLPVHAGTGHQDSVADRLRSRFADHPWKPALVHRLDRDTSGLLIVAKTYARLQALQFLWRKGEVRKTYLVWVHGRPPWREPVLLRDETAKVRTDFGEKMRVGAGKPSRTLVRTLFQSKDAALVLVAPLTGRTHQIRVQLASRGHPLIGDVKYGGPPRPGGMLLHAWHIAWPGQEFHLLPNWSPPGALPPELSMKALSDATRELAGDRSVNDIPAL
ncbi:RluA family pseudouridine synthase [Desulfonatronum sp. SC1]|uniref:RluA family pseudouridine synthase n=1 Tax=Desulfonatronum sp. SC1 TaxID=2109626 RepID=UPI000D302A8B|nr:RluA family pseudouridine synthase [Desulfonatronum sp. SC1]PTN33954.1 RluA family pseudouridine synthase [Desulfonatronum sp. SC1]